MPKLRKPPIIQVVSPKKRRTPKGKGKHADANARKQAASAFLLNAGIPIPPERIPVAAIPASITADMAPAEKIVIVESAEFADGISKEAITEQLAKMEAQAQETQRISNLIRQRDAVGRMLKAKLARDSLITFAELMMPNPDFPEDAMKTRYEALFFHKAMAAALEEVEKGNKRRVIIAMPPRHGKTRLAGNYFPAWYVGRDPYRSFAYGTYNQTFAEDQGREVRNIMQNPLYGQVFPDLHLRKGEQASDRLRTEEGGLLAFVGRGGTITGRGADGIVVDDPIKGRKEADSQAIRDDVWKWLNDDIMTRFMTDEGWMILIQTRWHEDDPIGRLIDPTNPYFDPATAAQWEVINLLALIENQQDADDDPLGRKVGEALWPARFGVPYLEDYRRRNPGSFASLFQQRPTPEDGDYFTADMIKECHAREIPALEHMRIYAASDHAVGTGQKNDLTCILIVGVDARGNIWLLDCWWQRATTDVVVEAMLKLMEKWRPITWFAENGHISKSIGPFLRRRMQERRVYIHVVEQTPVGDKATRAQSIKGRMAMGMVRFPRTAWWYQGARRELLKFRGTGGQTHDDFVDTLAHIGLGLDTTVPARAIARAATAPPVGTFGWVKAAAARRKREGDHSRRMRSM